VCSAIPRATPHDKRGSDKRRQGREHDQQCIQDRHYRTSALNVTLPVSDINAGLTIAQLFHSRAILPIRRSAQRENISVVIIQLSRLSSGIRAGRFATITATNTKAQANATSRMP
jgi:hypothetical protein